MSHNFATPEDALAHYGVPGMRWGHRKAGDDGGSGGPTRKQAVSDVRDVGNTARTLIRESRRAATPKEREAAAKKYDDLLTKIQTPEFKASYQKASTMGKGQMAVHAVAFGPFAAITIPAARKMYKKMGEEGYEMEIDVAHQVLAEMRS